MRWFLKPIRIRLPHEVLLRAQTFADQVLETVDYADSNQHQRQKIRQDHYVSKLGEEAVFRVFQAFDAAITAPDYTIYRGKQKSWAPDLQVNGLPLAVKTQTKEAAARYGLSWTFQCAPSRRDPILDDATAWVCFVEVDPEAHLCRVFPPFQIHELPFAQPRLPHLIGKKRVVYADALTLKDDL